MDAIMVGIKVTSACSLYKLDRNHYGGLCIYKYKLFVTTVKQALLHIIGQILSSHSMYRRSPDAHFKAFICAGLK